MNNEQLKNKNTTVETLFIASKFIASKKIQIREFAAIKKTMNKLNLHTTHHHHHHHYNGQMIMWKECSV